MFWLIKPRGKSIYRVNKLSYLKPSLGRTLKCTLKLCLLTVCSSYLDRTSILKGSQQKKSSLSLAYIMWMKKIMIEVFWKKSLKIESNLPIKGLHLLNYFEQFPTLLTNYFSKLSMNLFIPVFFYPPCLIDILVY